MLSESESDEEESDDQVYYDDSSDEGSVVRCCGRGTEAHEAAFGDHTNINVELRNNIDMLRDNDPEFSSFSFKSEYTGDVHENASVFKENAFELMGQYIAKNRHLDEFSIDVPLSDSKGASLFRGLTSNQTIKSIYIHDSDIGINIIRSMVPFLESSPNVQDLSIRNEANIDTECLELLAETLAGGPITNLSFYGCNIRSVSSLENFTQLVRLGLASNNIGYAGCKIVLRLLQNDQCFLEELDLRSTNIGHEGVEKIAKSLEGNKTLHTLRLDGNEISESGGKVLLKILNNVSSIEATCISNCTLRYLSLYSTPYPKNYREIQWIVNSVENAVRANYDDWRNGRGQANFQKVRQIQLNSETRKKHCKYQGIEYSHGSIFAGIESVLLPDLLALVGGLHGQTDVYRMLLSTSNDLICLVDKQTMLKDSMKQLKSSFKKLSWDYSNMTFLFKEQSSNLAAKFFDMNERLVSLKSRESNIPQNMMPNEPDTTWKTTIEEIRTGAIEFSHKSATLTGKIDGMMEDICGDFPGLSGTKRKRSSSI